MANKLDPQSSNLGSIPNKSTEVNMITKILNGVIWYDYKGDEICWNGGGVYIPSL